MAALATHPEQSLVAIEELVGAPVAPPVRDWLLSGDPPHLFSLPLLGLPIGAAPDNIWGGTMLLQATRPDLPRSFLAIRLLDGRALCIGTAGAADTPLFEIDLDQESPPRDLGLSFEDYIAEGRSSLARTERIFDHVEAILCAEGHDYDHARGGRLPRAHQRRVVRSCVHDMVVGIASLRQDEKQNATMVGLFECTDHPLYEPGHGVRSLTSMILADAFKSGVSMALRFEPVEGLRGTTVPEPLVTLARALEVGLAARDDGRVSHQEGAALFLALAGISDDARQKIAEAGARERISAEAVAYLVLSRCWTAEEADWILHAAPRPAAVLFGDDMAEDWLLKSEAAWFGRAAILATMLRASLTGDGEEGADTIRSSVSGGVFLMEPRRACRAPWLDDRELAPGEQIALLPRPRAPLAFEASLLTADATRLAAASPAAGRRWLVLGAEAAEVDLDAALPALEALGVEPVISPYRIADLQAMYEARLARARRVRR